MQRRHLTNLKQKFILKLVQIKPTSLPIRFILPMLFFETIGVIFRVRRPTLTQSVARFLSSLSTMTSFLRYKVLRLLL